jgi:hypothetical protein
MNDLADITVQLTRSHRELGELLAAEREGRIMAYQMTDETSVSAKDRAADVAVLPLSIDIIKLKCEIKALEVEWQFLMGESYGFRPGCTQLH